MFINNIDIATYGASVSKKIIQSSEILIEKEKVGLSQIVTSKKVNFKKISLKLLFEGIDRDIIDTNISNFMVNFMDEVTIKFKNISKIFKVCLVGHSIDDTDFDDWLYLNMELEGYMFKPEAIETINRVTSKTINVSGNQETPCIVEITPSVSIIDLTLNGFTDDPVIIKNLTVGKRVIINGEDGTVLENGVNKFSDVDLWEWPRLLPGANTITSSRNNVDITVKYKPRYI